MIPPKAMRGRGRAASKGVERSPEAAPQDERGLPPVKQTQAPAPSAAPSEPPRGPSSPAPPDADALPAPPSSTAAPIPSAAPLQSVAPPSSANPPSDFDAVVVELSHRLVRGASRVLTTFVGVPTPARTEAASPIAPLSEETRQLLTTLDDQLVDVLERGDIRLVRSKWLLALPLGRRLVRRQELNAIGGVEPLLTPQEAVAAIRKGNRGVGALSHGWMSPVCAHFSPLPRRRAAALCARPSSRASHDRRCRRALTIVHCARLAGRPRPRGPQASHAAGRAEEEQAHHRRVL